MEKRRLLEADVDEGGLHAGQHPLDPRLVYVADDAAVAQALDVDLGELVPLDDGDTRLLGRAIEDDLLFHVSKRGR